MFSGSVVVCKSDEAWSVEGVQGHGTRHLVGKVF